MSVAAVPAGPTAIDRDVFLRRQFQQRVFPGGGIIRPLVFAECRISSVAWTRRAARQHIDVWHVSASIVRCANAGGMRSEFTA